MGETKLTFKRYEKKYLLSPERYAALRQQLDAYKALVLPSAQISAELQAQWPDIENVTLARADSAVLVVLTEKQQTPHSHPLGKEELERIEDWLSVRLRTPSVQVIKINP